MTMLSSSRTGQGALQKLPRKSQTHKRTIDNYVLPDHIVEDVTGTNRRKEGIAVWKVNKYGKLQSRRLAFSADRRSLLVTSNKIKSIKSFFTRSSNTKKKNTLSSSAADAAQIKRIPIASIDRIQRGVLSERFRKALVVADSSNNSNGGANTTGASELQELLQGEGSFSIIYQTEPGDAEQYESLDLAVPDPVEFHDIVSALEALVALQDEEGRYATRQLQILRRHWHALLKEHDTPLNLTEWMTLAVDRLELPLSKSRLQDLFYEACDEKNVDDLSLTSTALLIDKVNRITGAQSNDPVETLWNALIENDPVPVIGLDDSASYDSYELSMLEHAEESISAVAFLSFLRSQQKEFSKTMQDVTDLFDALNQQQTAEDVLPKRSRKKSTNSSSKSRSRGRDRKNKSPRKQQQQPPPTNAATPLASPPSQDEKPMTPADRITKSRFLSFMQSDANDIFAPNHITSGNNSSVHTNSSGTVTMDMTQPLSHYWIATSHDTYLACLRDDTNFRGAPMQIPLDCDAQQFYAALLRGVRCLEVTLWDTPGNSSGSAGTGSDTAKRLEPMIDCTGQGPGIPWMACLQAIRHYLKQDPYTFPILLRIENHCSTLVQTVMAKQLHEMLGMHQLVYEPMKPLTDGNFVLPSPVLARGKVIVLAKRPNLIKAGARVMHDDYDEDNSVWQMVLSPSDIKSFDEENPREYNDNGQGGGGEAEQDGIVIGFNTMGPIRAAADSFALSRTPTELLDKAEREAEDAQREAAEAKLEATKLEERAQQKESEALNLAQKAGVPLSSVAGNRQASPSSADSTAPSSRYYSTESGEEKSMKDEGMEVHEILKEYAEHGRDNYAVVAQEALNAANLVMTRHAEMNAAQKEMRAAQIDLEHAQGIKRKLEEEARKARSEAAAHQEQAYAARARLAKVQELVDANEETATSAETVVITAMTEAKISEKRASDAEARAARALATAENDRARADEETSKEEELEQQVNDVLENCALSNQTIKASRERVEKAAAMLDRVNEQIKLIENSSQYKKELAEGVNPDAGSPVRHGGSFVAKHAAKLQEREKCKQLIKEASGKLAAADEDRLRLQKDFEEYNHVWKAQAELAAKVRKLADRSGHVAEELAEHAEEEREAANLRHVACQKAEATVASRGSHKTSLATQLNEAEKGAAEAAQMAMKSRKRADQMSNDAEKVTDADALLRIFEEKKWAYNQAKAQVDSAVREKETKDNLLLEEKRRIEFSDEVNRSVGDATATQVNRIQVEELYQKEASSTYRQATIIRDEAEEAVRLSQKAEEVADLKSAVARRAREYKEKMELVTEISPALAKLTLLHTLRHWHWEKSLALSNANVHSIAYNVLMLMVANQPEIQLGSIRQFTLDHMCRIFPSWKRLQGSPMSNYDPMLPWSLGCQLVAMNYHSCDERLVAAEGLFRQNGSCGYVLKPDHLRGGSLVESKVRWKFQIMSGCNLPRPAGASRSKSRPMHPVVRVTLHPGFAGGKPCSFETTKLKQRGPNPVFGDHGGAFEIEVLSPSTSVISLLVFDDDPKGGQGSRREFIGGAAIPVTNLRQGFRSVALFDSKHARSGAHAFASLLVLATQQQG